MNKNDDKINSNNILSSNLITLNQHNDILNNDETTINEINRNKRNRPLSSYLEENFDSINNFTINDNSSNSTIKIDNYTKTINKIKSSSQLKKKSSFASITSPLFQKSKSFSSKLSESPLSNRVPLKNLSNIQSSIKAISKASHNFFNNFHMTTTKSSNIKEEQQQEEEDIPTDCDSDEDDDTFDTIELGSPTENIRNRSQKNSISISNSNTSPSKISSTTTTTKLFNKPNFRRYHSLSTTQKEIDDFHFQENDNNNINLKNSTINFFKSNSNDMLLRINENQLHRIINGKHNHEFNNFTIIDCRFKYEFDGGHIDSAININSYDDLELKIKELMKHQKINEKNLIIFHCEFSVYRSILMAQEWRRYDRLINKNNYPILSWPDIVILEGGYKKFYENFPDCCFPKAYIPMNHNNDSKSLLNNIRNENKLLNRAKSFNQFSINCSSNSMMDFWNVDNEQKQQQHNKSLSFSNLNNSTNDRKIIKRQKSNSTFSAPNYNSPELLNSSSPLISPTLQQFQFNDETPPTTTTTTQRPSFLPPSTIFRNTQQLYLQQHHRKSYSSSFSSSSLSINSSISCNSSLNSESSLLNFDTPNSPIIDSNLKNNINTQNSPNLNPPNSLSSSNSPILDYFDSKKSISTTTTDSNSSSSINSNNFQFPQRSLSLSLSTSKPIKPTPVSATTITSSSSPIISSPLSMNLATPKTTSEDPSSLGLSTTLKTCSSFIDPINDTPVDFSIPSTSTIIEKQSFSKITNHSFSKHAFNIDELNSVCNINEVDEEET
ncbi:MIH1 [Candida jiufengensis]|uniref:MIH1 n=1 Tax=Candida jiufengensis TaxID=497108 RepID=UPI002224057C|nr:MIH1 [Candida jiufengensis]KAI5953195.1 MIH1 [Candida jiufengensis]